MKFDVLLCTICIMVREKKRCSSVLRKRIIGYRHKLHIVWLLSESWHSIYLLQLTNKAGNTESNASPLDFRYLRRFSLAFLLICVRDGTHKSLIVKIIYSYVLTRIYTNIQTFLVSADCKLDSSHICREGPLTNSLIIISIGPNWPGQ